MSTAEQTIVGEIVTNNIHQPIKFDVTNEAIRTLWKRLTGLKADTPANYFAVKSGITEVRTLRVRVDATRKELKEDALKYGRLVDSEAKRITDLLVAIEEPLKAEKQKADDAKEREKQAIAEAKQRAHQIRLDALLAVGYRANLTHLIHWSDEEYAERLATATDDWETKTRKDAADRIEAERIEAERVEAVRLDKIKLDADRLEYEKQMDELYQRRAEQDARERAAHEAIETERKAMQAEIERLDAIGLANERAIKTERLAKEQAEQAKIDEQNRIEREAIEAERKAIQAERDRMDQEEKERQQAIYIERKAKEQAEKDRVDANALAVHIAEENRLAAIRVADEAKRIEALKPDAEKLKILGDTLRLLAYPEMATDEGKEMLSQVMRWLSDTAQYCDECLR